MGSNLAVHVFDPKTGEIMTTKQKPVFDEEKLREEEKFDGYYAIVSSEWEKKDEEIVEIYRGLWRKDHGKPE